MADNPTLGWDEVPYFGWWETSPGVPAKGSVNFLVTPRIRRTDGRMVYPGGVTKTVVIGDVSQHEPDVVNAVKAGMKAVAQREQGNRFDDARWEQWWNAKLESAIFTKFWASDDPEITPKGWPVTVSERIDGAQSKPYPTYPTLADRKKEVPGINLAMVEFPEQIGPTPPSYTKGQPGGVAALDSDGDVVNAQGVKVGAVDPAEIDAAVDRRLDESPPSVDLSGVVRTVNGLEPDEDGNVTLDTGGGGEPGPVAWDDVQGKPAEFPPSKHDHPEYVRTEDLPASPDLTGHVTSPTVATIWSGTAAEYDALTPNPATLYAVADRGVYVGTTLVAGVTAEPAPDPDPDPDPEEPGPSDPDPPPGGSLITRHVFDYPDRQVFLDHGWTYTSVRPDGTTHWTEDSGHFRTVYNDDGALRVPLPRGGIYGSANDPTNLISRPLTDRVKTVTAHITTNFTDVWATAQLMLFTDENNYWGAVKGIGTDGPYLYGVHEQDGTPSPSPSVLQDPTDLWLRVTLDAGEVTTYWSPDGNTWNLLGTFTSAPDFTEPVHVAILGQTGPIDAGDYFLLHEVVIEEHDDKPPMPEGVSVATWRDGHAGAFSVSVDDGYLSGRDELDSIGKQGTFVMNGIEPPEGYAAMYATGHELGPHLVSHPCFALPEATLREEIENNVAGVEMAVTNPADINTLIWPCGYGGTDPDAQAIAAEYVPWARGYHINQLEDPSPVNFYNLKCFNSREHEPFPPADLKTIVDMAVAEGKWANLVLHEFTNDDGAIVYAATKDVFYAPIGTVMKYIMQRDRTYVTDYTDTPGQVTFDVARTPMPSTERRDFEDIIRPEDIITLVVDVTGTPVASVTVDDATVPHTVRGDHILFNTVVSTTPTTVTIVKAA